MYMEWIRILEEGVAQLAGIGAELHERLLREPPASVFASLRREAALATRSQEARSLARLAESAAELGGRTDGA